MNWKAEERKSPGLLERTAKHRKLLKSASERVALGLHGCSVNRCVSKQICRCDVAALLPQSMGQRLVEQVEPCGGEGLLGRGNRLLNARLLVRVRAQVLLRERCESTERSANN